jgi:hypothetical protein
MSISLRVIPFCSVASGRVLVSRRQNTPFGWRCTGGEVRQGRAADAISRLAAPAKRQYMFLRVGQARIGRGSRPLHHIP